MNLFSRSHKVLWTQTVLPAEISFDISVIAGSDLQIRLVNPKDNKTGRVEIYHPSFGWGTVCGLLHWTIVEGGVVCRQLNFTGAKAVKPNSDYYGAGSGPILLDNIKCTGNESYIWECSHSGWNVYHRYCDRYSVDVGVDCYWCQAYGDRYWTGNFIDLKVFMWVFIADGPLKRYTSTM